MSEGRIPEVSWALWLAVAPRITHIWSCCSSIAFVPLCAWNALSAAAPGSGCRRGPRLRRQLKERGVRLRGAVGSAKKKRERRG